ncbi:MAG: hypothetical protein ABI632_13995, partial [Pseudolysinimonas sp.]
QTSWRLPWPPASGRCGHKDCSSLASARFVPSSSLVRLGLELASSRIADWSTASVLIVGTGRYAATAVAALRERGATDLRVYSPTGREAAFATKYGLTPSEDFGVDVVVTCTANAVLGVERFTGNGNAHRIVIDLGLPRNVDAAVGRLPGIELLDLETISLHAPLEELAAHDDARELVRTAARGFTAEGQAEPAIVALRTHIFALLDAEIARAQARGAGPETEAALRHLAGVLLHEPSVRARDLAAEGRAAEFATALETLHGIRVAPTVDRAETA